MASSTLSAMGMATTCAVQASARTTECSSARTAGIVRPALASASCSFARGRNALATQAMGASRVARASRSGMRVFAGVPEINEDTFEAEVLGADVPVVVDFWATWCGPCKLVAPLMDWAQNEYGTNVKVVKCETDPSPALVEKYKVYGLPTLILFKDGEEVEGSKREGAINKAKFEAWLADYGVTK